MIQIQIRFQKLLGRIEPRPPEVERAARHFTLIQNRISRSYPVSRIVRVGSHSKHTAVRTFSDLDIFAVLRRRAARWGDDFVQPATLLLRMRTDLEARFPQTTVRRDGQAIVVRFEQGNHAVDVVPAIFDQWWNKIPLYRIPDGAGGWLLTSPNAHAAYFRRQNTRTGGKLRRVVQLVKWWTWMRTPPIPLSSFHVEIVLADANVGVGAITYADVLADAFAVLADRDGRAIRDPLGISGLIAATETDAKRDVLCRHLDHATEHATAALTAERGADWQEAIRQWQIVFNGQFPA